MPATALAGGADGVLAAAAHASTDSVELEASFSLTG